MKCLTLKHPWAFAVAHLDKRIENRTWKPPSALLGERIAIHGGAVPKGYALEDALLDTKLILRDIITSEYVASLSDEQQSWLRAHNCSVLSTWITPGIVATAVLDGVVTRSASPWFKGPYGWVLEDVVTLAEPVPCKGAQGLWELPEAVAAQVSAEELRRRYG